MNECVCLFFTPKLLLRNDILQLPLTMAPYTLNSIQTMVNSLKPFISCFRSPLHPYINIYILRYVFVCLDVISHPNPPKLCPLPILLFDNVGKPLMRWCACLLIHNFWTNKARDWRGRGVGHSLYLLGVTPMFKGY